MSAPAKPLDAYPDVKPGEAPSPPASDPDGGEAARDPAPAKRREVEIAVLDFLDPAGVRGVVALKHPFRYDGREIREIHLRRLSVFEAGLLADAVREADHFVLIGAMAGLPAAVLRGLMWEDLEAVRAAADPLSALPDDMVGSSAI